MSRVSFPSPFLNENGKMGLPKLENRKNTTINLPKHGKPEKSRKQPFTNLGIEKNITIRLSQTWETRKK